MTFLVEITCTKRNAAKNYFNSIHYILAFNITDRMSDAVLAISFCD